MKINYGCAKMQSAIYEVDSSSTRNHGGNGGRGHLPSPGNVVKCFVQSYGVVHFVVLACVLRATLFF